MKRTLTTALLCLLASLPASAALVWYESFNYVDGPIVATGTNIDGSTNWFRHSGTAGPSDAVVANHQLQNSATGGSLSRQDDVNRKLAIVEGDPITNAPTVLYASFSVNCTNVPTVSNYFAHFVGTDGIFRAKVFGLPGDLPGTWRLGVSGGANNVSQVFPFDLATGADYQVVIGWDPVSLFSATLWVNPVTWTDASVASSDAVAQPNPAAAFAFRQASSFSSAFFNITNLAVATTFEEAASAVWTTEALAPVVVVPPKDGTNYVGDTINLSILADGQGLASLNYQWRKNGVDIPNLNGNSNVFTVAAAVLSDSGKYDVVVSTAAGLWTTSATASLLVTNPPVPPTITKDLADVTVYFGETAALSITAGGAPPLSYQWYFEGSAIAGATDASLSIPNVQANNGTTGTYRCNVSNGFGTTPSKSAVLSAIAPPSVTIGYLRTLVDPVFFLPTNTTALWTVTGIVTSHTNLTTAANSSFYLQDETGGIDVFFAGTTEARPEAGDSVTVTGPLGQFNSLLELNLSASNPSHQVVTNSHGNPLPAGIVLPFSFTNSPAFGGTGKAIQLYQGAVITFTNVFFPDGFAGTNVFASGKNYTLTNQAGETFAFRVDARVGDIIGQPIPPFAWTVTGPMSFFLGNTVADRSSGYQLLPTLYADIVTNAPPPVLANIALEGGKPTLTWTAQPYMSYSVYGATELSGPYLPITTGRTFNNPTGKFTDTSADSGRFYKITSP